MRWRNQNSYGCFLSCSRDIKRGYEEEPVEAIRIKEKVKFLIPLLILCILYSLKII